MLIKWISSCILALCCYAVWKIEACPNRCSGHGYCFDDDAQICTCYQGFTGPDCSLRKSHNAFSLTSFSSMGQLIWYHKHTFLFSILPHKKTGVCPAGRAWADIPSSTNVAHAAYSECSSMVRWVWMSVHVMM